MLNVDLFFHAALELSPDVINTLGGRVFNTARPEIDEEEDRIPYVIISYDGGGSDGGTKDSRLSTLSSATVSVLIVAESRNDLARIANMVHSSIESAFRIAPEICKDRDWPFVIYSASESAGPVQLDPMKPCYFQTLTYQCNTYDRNDL